MTASSASRGGRPVILQESGNLITLLWCGLVSMIEMCAECHLLCFFLTSRLLLAGVIRVVLPGGLGLWDQTQVEDVSSHAAGQGKWNLFAFSAVCYMLPICTVKPVRKLVIYENIYIYNWNKPNWGKNECSHIWMVSVPLEKAGAVLRCQICCWYCSVWS